MTTDVIEKAFRTAFNYGCDATLQEVRNSSRFNELRNHIQSLFLRFDENADKGIALRTGVGRMTTLLSKFSEEKALTKARERNPFFTPPINHRALIQVLGESLIDTAKNCLTNRMRNLAKEWRSASAGRQKEIAREVYQTLVGQKQRKETELHMSNVYEVINQRRADNSTSDREQVLPKQYGAWSDEGHPANCQGKTQMLAAFARLAGADVMCIKPTRDSRSVIDTLRDEIKDYVEQDMRKRNITPEETFADSLMAQNILTIHQELFHFFHVGVVLRIRDGSWVLIDPHVLNFSSISPEYRMEEIHLLLEKYGEVLPGLTISAQDESAESEIRKEVQREVDDILQHSRRLEDAIPEEPTLIDLINNLKSTDEIEFIMSRMGGEEFENMEPQEKEYAATMLAIGQENHLDPGFLLSRGQDPEFIKERIDTALSSYHNIALDWFRERFEDGGSFPHPAMECALPEQTIALSALNSLADQWTFESLRFFLRHSSGQTYLHNAVAYSIRNEDSDRAQDVGQTAAAILRSRPVLHPLSQRILELSPY